MAQRKRRNFCDISPATYAISLKKEILKRHLKDITGGEKFAKEKTDEKLPCVIASHSSGLIKKGPGIDPTLQYNKANNIDLACKAISGTIIHPGETFSFWHCVGNTTKRKGYSDGRVIIAGKLMPGIGGGLCNLANTLNLLVLESSLDITEVFYHSDALAPDGEKRIPLSTGTSVSYNNIDYRAKNNTDHDYQIIAWCKDETLFAQLRSTDNESFRCEITEDDHHFEQEGEKYYRVSKIYRDIIEKENDKLIRRELLRDNRSEVMFDYSLIPKDQIR